MKKLLLIICVFIAVINASYAQTISYPVFAQSITRGLDSTLLTVRIDFPTCNNPIVNINLGFTENPGIIEYIPSSLTTIDASPGFSISEFNISDLRSPKFNFNTTASNKFIVFSIKRRANCGIATTTKDAIFVTGDCTFSDVDPDANAYLLKSPILTLIAPANLSNTDAGTAYNRNLSITNGGNGCIDTLFFWIKYPAASMQFNSLKMGTITIAPSFNNGDSILFKISGTSFFGADNKFCNGETINLTENVTVKKCNVTTAYGTSWNNYYNTNCEAIVLNSGMTMSNNIPNLAVTVPNPIYDYCFKGESIVQKMRITNSGTGTAANVAVNMNYLIPGSGSGYVLFDTTKAWVVRNNLGDSIGVMKNFTNVTTITYYNAGCTISSAMTFGTGSLGALLIPAGTYVEVDVQTVTYNFACIPTYCPAAEGWLSLQTTMSYKNQCGTANYSQGPVNQYNRFYFYIVPTVEMPTSILPGPFTVNIDFSNFITMNHPNGTGETYLVSPLPANISLGASTVTLTAAGTNYVYGFSTTSPYSSSTDSLWIGPITQNIALYTDLNMKIPLVASCGTSGTRVFNFFAFDKYSSCATLRKFSCNTSTTYLSCPQLCPKGGATPTAFNLKRINFGIPDNDNNHLPDASGAIDFTKINDHHSVNGDTLKATWNARIYPNVEIADPNYGQNVQYVYVDFELGTAGAGARGTVNALPNAKIKIYPNGNVSATPILCSVSPTIIGTKAHYEFNTACRTGAWQPNDSLVIEALFTVNEHNAYNYGNSNVAGFSTFTTNIELYSSYTQKTTPQLAPSNGQTYTCYHINDYNQISTIWLSDYIPSDQVIDGCNTTVIAHMRQYVRNQEYPNIFPYEYRTFGSYETMNVTLPPGFIYTPNSAALYQSNLVSSSAVFPDARISQVGNILTFSNIKASFTNYGGTIIPADETESIYFYFKIEPTCTATNGAYPNFTKTSFLGNGVNTPNVPYNYIYGFGNNSGWVYTSPQPAISTTGLIQSTDGTATWNVNLQNQSNRVTAPNSFIFISPVNTLVNVIVKEGATIITPDANGFYRLGNMATSANRNLTITANSGNCNMDSMKVNFGWNCGTYPSSISSVACSLPSWLGVNNYQSQIQLAVTKQPDPILTNCNGETIEIVMGSAQAAFSKNPSLRLTPPAGLSFSQGQFEYPLGSGNWQTITPVVVGNIYTYNLQDHTQLTSLWGGPKGLPGTINNAGADGRQAKLKITYGVDCSYQNGSRISIQQRADRPCGDQISDDNGYNKIVKTDPIFVSPTSICITGDTNFTIAPQVGTVEWKDLPWSLGHVPTPCESAQILFTGVGSSPELVTVNVTTDVNIKNLILLNRSSAPVTKIFQTIVQPGIKMFMNGNVTMSAAAALSQDSVIFNTKGNGLMTVTGYTKIGYPADNAYSIFGTVPNATMYFDYILKGDLIFNDKGFNRAKFTNITFENDDTVRIVNNTNPAIYPSAVMFDKLSIGNTTAPIAILEGTNQNDFVNDNGGFVNINNNAKLILNANYSINAKDINTASVFNTSFILNNNSKLIVRGNTGGTTGSNFPKNFTAYNINANSTVDYNGTSSITQTIFAGVNYGKLLLSKETGTVRAGKNTIANLNVLTSIIVNPLVDFTLGGNVNSTGPFNQLGTAGLYCNANIVSGTGVYTMGDACYFGSGHAQGIHPLGVAQGNMQMTGGRTYTSTSNYIYNGIVSQNTGNGLPLNINEFTVDNPTTVNNTKDLVVNSLMKFSQGVFDINTTKLTSNGSGTITRTAGKIKADAGTVEMKGNTGITQHLSGNLFVNKILGTLINANTNSITVAASPADTLLISNAMLYGTTTTNSQINTGNNVTLLSRATQTARFGEIVASSGNSIVGRVTVERFIPATRKWRLLAWPTTSTQTAQQSLMENATTPNANPNPGYGCIVTDEDADRTIAGNFDSKSVSGPSVKYYDPATNKFIGIPNTRTFLMNSHSAYYNYVRGNRSSLPIPVTNSTTILRSTGTLKTGNQTFNIPAGKFDAIGNPYASPIDIRKLDTTGITGDIYVWDPKLTGVYGLGAYQVLYKSGSNYLVMPGGGSYSSLNSLVDTLESGQGFYVRARASGATITVKEDAKTIGARTFTRGAGTAQAEVVFALLNIVDPGVNTLVDGAMAAFDNSYSSNVDFDDALKLTNTSENVSFKRSNTLLAIERRSDVMVDDTLHLNMKGLRIKKYQWDVNIANMTNPGRTALLVDRFTNTTTNLSLEGVTNIQFDVTSTVASYAANRFMIVFKQIPMPTTQFTTISAIRNANKTIKVNYAVANETNIASYTIEQSNNGTTFTAIGTQAPIANNSGNPAYSFNDNNASLNNNWYRVKFTSTAGVTSYSAIAMVGATAEEVTVAGESKITVYPNPVVGGIVNLHLDNQAKGNYSIQITNSLGQIVETDKVQVQTNAVLKTIKLEGLAKGKYQLTVISEDGVKTNISFISK
jgi:Secretion system C-terminal sorting domain